jgi:predicted enzyme related to lactoylglutathione lyase
MSDDSKPAVGSIGWIDLTVEDAPGVRDFYARVVGWKPQAVPMGEYDDFNMTLPESGTPAAGVCHHRGSNVGIPPQWMIYITVADLDASVVACREGGGEVVYGPKDMGSHGRFCVIRDPAGAVAGLFQGA